VRFDGLFYDEQKSARSRDVLAIALEIGVRAWVALAINRGGREAPRCTDLWEPSGL